MSDKQVYKRRKITSNKNQLEEKQNMVEIKELKNEHNSDKTLYNSNINSLINELNNYALNHELITEEDIIYMTNSLYGILHVEDAKFNFVRSSETRIIDDILEDILNYAINKELISNYTYVKEMLDTKICDLYTPRPSEVIKTFFNLYKENKEKATNYFYNLMIDVNYVRKNRIDKNILYKVDSRYGMIDISINLSKPEKDSKEIAKLKELKNNTKYPKCQLCYENVGYQGRANHPARNNLRVIPVKLNNEDFYLQYSPYGYFNEHAIILKREHENMKISEITFIRLLDFLDMFPHYFIGSNADLPIVGGSILDHEHYQGGRATFAMDNAKVLYQKNIGHVQVNYLDWPLDTIELETGKEHRDELLKLANQILYKWRRYSKPSINIFNSLEDLHNTITPIARMRNNNYVLKLVLRNNYTTSEKPYGLYHPDVDLHHIKKENIGLIEVLGLAILPARLKKELTILDEIVQGKRNESDIELIANHKEWYEEIKNMENLNINNEVGKIFVKVLESCKVFKYGSIDDVIEFIDSFVI